MPYLCRVTIAGPQADDGGVSTVTDAVADAVQNGWHAPRVPLHDEEPDDHTSADGGVLDYRVLGYPGGAIILVVLDCDSFMQASIVAAALAQHLITWSPGLLEYVPSGLEISQRDEPYSEDNWLPPIADKEPAPQRHWPLAELLDENVKKVAGEYLLATAIRAVWHPTEHAYSDRAEDIVVGAVEYPWSVQLSHALGVLLIRAARFERRNGSQAKLIAHGSGDLALAQDLLRRARETSDDHDSNGFTVAALGELTVRHLQRHLTTVEFRGVWIASGAIGRPPRQPEPAVLSIENYVQLRGVCKMLASSVSCS